MICYGAFTVVGNILGMLLFGDAATAQSTYTDKEGTQITYQMSYSIFLASCLIKFIFGAMIYKEGKWLKKMFQPLLKEYVDAETGVTNGVTMKRHSKDMKKLRCKLRRTTCGCAALMVACLFISYNCAYGAMASYLDQKYEFYNANNMTNFTASDKMFEKM